MAVEMEQAHKIGDGEWSAEHHLAALSIEQNRLENETETNGSNLNSALASPFKVGSILCENFRKNTVKCIENLSNNDIEKSGLHDCFESLILYNQCTAEILSKHSGLAAALAEKSKSFFSLQQEKGQNV